MTYSQRPTPPAWGQTGTPNLTSTVSAHPSFGIDGEGTVLCSHQENTENLAHAGKSAGVNLADVDGLRLQKLFEHHAIVRVLAGSDSNAIGLECLTDSSMPQDIIGRRGLLNEP